MTKGLITHRIMIGDSLQKLARMYDIADFREIAYINDLEEPYINSDFDDRSYIGNERVKNVGDIILIPSTEARRIENKDTQKEAEILAYGKDLDLYHGFPSEGRLKGNLGSNNNDLDIVQGLSNLSQQLQTRLSTKKGALLLHKDFGSNLDRFIGLKITQELLNKIMWEAEETIRSDFRVSDVKDIRAEVIDGKIGVFAKIIPLPPSSEFDFTYYVKI